MKKIFEDSKDLHVSATILFAGSDNYLYVDEEKNTKASKAEIIDCFTKGLLVATDTGMAKPYILATDDDYASVSYDNGTALVTLYSDGYEEETVSDGTE